MVVGAYAADGNGSAYVFCRNQGGADKWGQVAKISASDGAPSDGFGSSVSIDGDTVIVGASQDDDNGFASGSAYVFYRNQGGTDSWGQVAKISASDGVDNGFFGCSVSIDDDTVVVGAHGVNGTGPAYVFYRNQGGTDSWGQAAKISLSDGDNHCLFGCSVSIDGDTVVVGDDLDNGTGSAYIFYRDQGGTDTWGQVAKISPADGNVNDSFGSSVDVSDDTVLIGASGDNSYSGSAYVYQDASSIGAVGPGILPSWHSDAHVRLGWIFEDPLSPQNSSPVAGWDTSPGSIPIWDYDAARTAWDMPAQWYVMIPNIANDHVLLHFWISWVYEFDTLAAGTRCATNLDWYPCTDHINHGLVDEWFDEAGNPTTNYVEAVCGRVTMAVDMYPNPEYEEIWLGLFSDTHFAKEVYILAGSPPPSPPHGLMPSILLLLLTN